MDVSNFIKNNKYTIIVVSILFFIFIFRRQIFKEHFTSWDTDFSCELNNINGNGGVTSDAEPIKTKYIEGEDILTSYYTGNAFNVNGFTENL